MHGHSFDQPVLMSKFFTLARLWHHPVVAMENKMH